MSIMGEIAKRIDQTADLRFITYRDFSDLTPFSAVALALSRLCKQGVIKRLQRGRYYKPKKTKFGERGPADQDVLEELLGGNDYVSGVAAYNFLGLSTQVPNEITIRGSKYNRRTKVGSLRIRYVRRPTISSSCDPRLYQLLDAYQNIKKIPDAKVSDTFYKLSSLVKELSKVDQKSLAKLALTYKPSVRALVGVTLERINKKLALDLKKSLNPLSKYKIGFTKIENSTFEQWRLQ